MYAQLYFDEMVTDEVYPLPHCAARSTRTMKSEDDLIFRCGGEELMLGLPRDKAGYIGTFDRALQIA